MKIWTKNRCLVVFHVLCGWIWIYLNYPNKEKIPKWLFLSVIYILINSLIQYFIVWKQRAGQPSYYIYVIIQWIMLLDSYRLYNSPSFTSWHVHSLNYSLKRHPPGCHQGSKLYTTHLKVDRTTIRNCYT